MALPPSFSHQLIILHQGASSYNINYLCTCDLYTPVHNVLEAWIYITWGSWRGLGPGIPEFFGPCDMAHEGGLGPHTVVTEEKALRWPSWLCVGGGGRGGGGDRQLSALDSCSACAHSAHMFCTLKFKKLLIILNIKTFSFFNTQPSIFCQFGCTVWIFFTISPKNF